MAIINDWFVDFQNRVVVHVTTELAYDAQTANFNVGATLTGGTSTATAIIVADTDSGTTGTLDLVYVKGTFQNNETITDNGSTPGSATSNIPSGVTTKSATYTSRQLYSYLQDTFDELGQMDDTVPMSAQTPTEFTMINSWFIDDESTKFLTGGAISTSAWDADVYDAGIRVFSFGGTYTNAVNSDIGREVGYSGGAPTDTGTLLHFNNTTKTWWVRVDDTGDVFSNTTTAIDLDNGSGTGTGILSGASISGDSLYANIYTLGTIETNPKPKTYVFQNSEAISEWWGRGDSSAHIDVLIKVKEADVEIDGANITVFVRHFGDLFDHFGIDLSSGGRNAVPLASQTDLNNNSTGEQILSVTSVTDFTAGQFVRGVTSGAYGEIISVDAAATPDTITVGNIVGASTFTDSETVKETSDGTASGDSGTETTLTAPHKTDAVAGYNNIIIAFVNGTATHGTVTSGPFTNNETVSWTGGQGVMIKDTGDNGTMTIGNCTLTSINGLVITGSSSGATTTASQNLQSAHTTPKAFSQQTEKNYDVIIDCATRTLAQVYEWLKYVTREDANSTQKNYKIMYKVISAVITQQDGEEYIQAYTGYTPVKASPFGTFAGGKLFGAQGVWVENMAAADSQNFQLIDSSGTTQTPPNFQSLTVSGVVAGDKIAIFRTSGGTTINKSVYTSHASQNIAGGDTFYFAADPLPTDVPTSGIIRIVDDSDTSVNREQRHFYATVDNTNQYFSGLSPVLDRTYGGSDKAYVPYLDITADATSESVTVIYQSERTVLARVRRYDNTNPTTASILPFESAGTFASTGFTVAAIRTQDSIVTAL